MTALLTLWSIPSPSQGVWYLGPVPLRGYALAIILGIVAAIWIGERRWIARGGRPGDVSDLALWAVPFGLVGGRLYHVATDWQLYFGEDRNPITALYVWRGGLGVWGAIALGAVGVVDRRQGQGTQGAAGARRHGARGAGRAGDRTLGQLVQPGALRPAHRPALGPGDRRRRTVRSSTSTSRPSTRRSSTSSSGAWRGSRSSSGPTAGSSSGTAGWWRSTSWSTRSAAAGSRCCGSTTSS